MRLRQTGARCFLASLLILTSAVCSAQTGRQQLDHFLTKLSSYQATFQQQLFDENLHLIEQADGRVDLQRPGRMRWEYLKPLPQIIIADGTRLWIYDPELAQVTVRDQDLGLGDTPASLLSSEEPVDTRFNVNDLGQRDDQSSWVSLTPKAAEPTFRDIRLGFKSNVLIAMEFRDNLDQITRLKFTVPKRNPNLDARLFQFQVPPGVDVIEIK